MRGSPSSPPARWPALSGGLTALLAAVLFGVSTPLVQHLGVGLGSFCTAALLYAGAAGVGALMRRPDEREAAVRRTDLPRLAGMILFGAVIGPVALAWGLQHTSGADASLLLTLEAVFTALLAALWYHESLGRRLLVALALITLGGAFLVLDRAAAGRGQLAGLLVVLAATASWGADNTLSRGLSSRDPGRVVMLKGTLGALATALLAAVFGESRPGLRSALGLLLVGAAGYGLSLRCYLLAQRSFGAARTGSVFAFAPLVGALVAVAMGERDIGPWMMAGGGLMLVGLTVHLLENHAHEHSHDALEHAHAHRHDDGHHGHEHDPMPTGLHSHVHRHAPMRHAHAHMPDEHHTHRH